MRAIRFRIAILYPWMMEEIALQNRDSFAYIEINGCRMLTVDTMNTARIFRSSFSFEGPRRRLELLHNCPSNQGFYLNIKLSRTAIINPSPIPKLTPNSSQTIPPSSPPKRPQHSHPHQSRSHQDHAATSNVSTNS